MDSLKPLEKNFVCFDKHYISNETNTGQLKHQKINNVQRSATNEQLRMSGNSGHYATIQDSSDENTLCTPKPRYYNATLGKRESSSDLYVSFNTGDRLPTSPNNERTPGYSYATNGEIHFLRDSNNENHQSKGTDDSTDTYLEPNPRRIGKSGDDSNHIDIGISWLSETHVYHKPDNGLWGTLTSTNDVCRVSSNKIVTAPYKKEKKLCNTCKIITCVNLVLLYTAATAYIVAVLMIGQAEEVVCGLNEMKDPSGSCKPVVCEDNPVVQNGLVNVINSTAILQCDPGFMANTTVNFQCMSNGSWISDSEAACVLRPCGSYSLSDNVEVSEDLSLINKSIKLRCAEGFDFKNKSENQIKCVNNNWKGTPECVKPERASTKENNASTSCGQGDDVNVVCKGLIVKDECEKNLGEIFVRIYWDEETSKCIARCNDSSLGVNSTPSNVATAKIQTSPSATTVEQVTQSVHKKNDNFNKNPDENNTDSDLDPEMSGTP